MKREQAGKVTAAVKRGIVKGVIKGVAKGGKPAIVTVESRGSSGGSVPAELA